MNLKVIESSDVELVVDLAEAKRHLYIPEAETLDDEELTLKIFECEGLAESFTQRFFLKKTVELALDGFPSCKEILLPRPPLIQVDSIQYYNESGSLTTFSSSNYWVDERSEPGRIVLKDGFSWPGVQSGRPNSVVITYKAGYGETHESIPRDLRSALKLLIASRWENRQEEYVVQGIGLKELPKGSYWVLQSYKALRF